MARSNYDLFLEQLARKRAPPVVIAERLLLEDRFDEAEREITNIDDSIYSAVEIARMYRRHLEHLVAAGEGRARLDPIFRRALLWAQGAYPEPHTAVEEEHRDAGRAEDRAELVGILGYDPD